MHQAVVDTLEELDRRVRSFVPDSTRWYAHYALTAIEEAAVAAAQKDFGVGTCLVDPHGGVGTRSHNHGSYPYSRSDLHAEMCMLDRFEEGVRAPISFHDHTLFTSLEPCSMCLVRPITAGVGHAYHAGPDLQRGIARKLHDLTLAGGEMARRQEFAEADAPPELKRIAHQIFSVTADRNSEAQQTR